VRGRDARGERDAAARDDRREREPAELPTEHRGTSCAPPSDDSRCSPDSGGRAGRGSPPRASGVSRAADALRRRKPGTELRLALHADDGDTRVA
jgi:hypothetical protein